MTPDSEPPATATAGRSKAAWVLLATVFVVGLIADLWSKSAAFAYVSREAPQTGCREIIPGVMRLTLSTNPGVVFGVNWMPDIMVLGATVAAVGVVIFFFVTSRRDARWTHAALGMILAGALGNLYDRLFTRVTLPGRTVESVHEVRDFIDFSPLRLGPLNYPWIFNIADVLLVVGVAILMIASLSLWREERAAARRDAAADAA